MKKTMKKALFCAVALCLALLASCAPQGQAPASQSPAPAAASPAPSLEPERTERLAASDDSGIEPLPFAALPAPLGGMSAEDYPVVDGSTATRPLSQALAYYFTGITDMLELDFLADHSTTDESYRNLLEKKVDLLLAYEPSPETRGIIERSGEEILMTPIGRDALVFLVNEKNPVKSLSLEQLQGIYSGKIKNWKEVGGEDLPIVAFQRPENSGSQTLMEKLVMKGKKMAEAPAELRQSEMGELIRAVAAFENEGSAIGYSVYYYASKMYAQEGVRLIAVNGAAPSAQSIADASYPFLNEFYVAIRGEDSTNGPAAPLFEAITGETGKKIIEGMGYVPVR
ncbi:MAG: substrate-binding domain-containing protein [Christensenellaceae bacterium]|jgi:ABC-type phosphate transport system substrate-binding protein|nr:substrate-binding domain-containing protein [Christensenellaceae bacterium]